MSLRLKTVVGVAFIEALLLALLIFTVMGHMHDNSEQALLKRSLTTAKLFASTAKDPVLAYDLASLDTFSKELISNPDIEYVRIRDSDGSILSSSGAKVFVEREFTQDFSLKLVDDGIFDTAAPISESGIQYGSVEIGINTDSIYFSIQQTQHLITLIAIVEMSLVALFSLMLGHYLTKQLSVLSSAAENVSKGDYSQKLVIKTKDEVGQVALAFNAMSSALRETKQSRDKFEADLIELNRTLEDHVELRTEKINAQIVELQNAHEKISETQAKLHQSEKLASLGQLSAGVAHEINNPIAFVHSNVSTLSEYVGVYQKLIALIRQFKDADTEKLEELKDQVRIIEEEEDIEFVYDDISSLIADTLDGTVRVKDIVKGLQEFSHANGDDRSYCSLIDCIKSTLKICNNELKHSCKVITEFNDLPLVHINRGEINQVLLNILMNARQAVGTHGTITIKTSHSDDMVCVSIRDDGPGISATDIAKLFDPFFTTKEVGIGTGLGLSISYGIVQDHGGDITVESTLGDGATFTVSIPALADNDISEAA